MPKILVVDDDRDTVDAVEERLKANQYVVITAFNGREALRKVRYERPHMIITDIVMPEMDGFGLFKELRNERDTANVPVLILTARGRMRDTFEAVGVNGFMEKPFDSQELLRKVRELLNEAPSKESQIEGPVAITQTAILGIGKKVLIIESSSKVPEEICLKLGQENCTVLTAQFSENIVSEVAKLKPDMILLELSIEMADQLEKLINSIAELSRKTLQNPNPLTSQIVLYRVPQEMGGVFSMEESAVSIENILDRCKLKGEFEYIGEYSAHSFIPKIKELLS